MKKIILAGLCACANLLAAGEIKIPARWQPPKIAGRDYWIQLIPRSYVIDNPSLMSLPLHQNVVWSIHRYNSQKIDFIGRILNAPQSHAGSA